MMERTTDEAITPAAYRAFQEAYDFFNAELFGGSLPHVLVTLQRHGKARGYFSPERFTGRTDDAAAHELAMNPDSFNGRSDELILSTLAHEMAHVWQQSHGIPPRRSYHDRQWAAKMKEIGLQPTATGEPGGKETGQHVTHYIIPGAIGLQNAKPRRRGRGCKSTGVERIGLYDPSGAVFTPVSRQEKTDQAEDRYRSVG